MMLVPRPRPPPVAVGGRPTRRRSCSPDRPLAALLGQPPPLAAQPREDCFQLVVRRLGRTPRCPRFLRVMEGLGQLGECPAHIAVELTLPVASCPPFCRCCNAHRSGAGAADAAADPTPPPNGLATQQRLP